jgi:hypothetical protein
MRVWRFWSVCRDCSDWRLCIGASGLAMLGMLSTLGRFDMLGMLGILGTLVRLGTLGTVPSSLKLICGVPCAGVW